MIHRYNKFLTRGYYSRGCPACGHFEAAPTQPQPPYPFISSLCNGDGDARVSTGFMNKAQADDDILPDSGARNPNTIIILTVADLTKHKHKLLCHTGHLADRDRVCCLMPFDVRLKRRP